jgi:hypothetical protein
VDEAGAALRRLGHDACRAGGQLDEIAEHIVVLDLQRLDAGFLGIGGLQAGNHPPRLVAQFAQFVEFGHGAIADEPAVTLEQRQILGEQTG